MREFLLVGAAVALGIALVVRMRAKLNVPPRISPVLKPEDEYRPSPMEVL